MSNSDSAVKELRLFQRPSGDGPVEPLFKPLSWSLIGRIFGFAAPVRGKLIALSVLTLIRSAQIPALVWLSAKIITGPIAGSDYGGVFYGTLCYTVLAILTEGMFHFRQRFALEIGETAVNGMRTAIFASLSSQPMSFYRRVSIGRILSALTSDLEAVRVGIQDVGFMTAVQLGQMIFAAVVMVVCDWHLFLVVAAVAPILWFVNTHFRLKFSRLTRESQGSFSTVTAALAESVNGMRVTQGFARQTTNAGLFRRLLVDHSRFNIELARTAGILTPLLELNSQVFVAIILLAGGWRFYHGALPVETLILFLLMANQFFSPIAVISALYSQGLIAMAGAERIFWLVDLPPEWKDAPDATDLPPDENGGVTVEFRNVSFGYDPTRPVLNNITFRAQPGETVALVGHTGSGKSSIINLIAKFYLPIHGEILINGRELRTLTSSSIHRRLGIVLQQNTLFSGTVLENIKLSRPEASDDDVRDALRKLDFLDLIEGLPQGLETEVGEDGAGLSIGQRQLVCFARAFLPDPPVILLDEATSAIDAVTDLRLQKALVVLLQNRTSFVVAHRLSTIKNAHQILVLDGGQIAESGTEEELLIRNGKYAALHQKL